MPVFNPIIDRFQKNESITRKKNNVRPFAEAESRLRRPPFDRPKPKTGFRSDEHTGLETKRHSVLLQSVTHGPSLVTLNPRALGSVVQPASFSGEESDDLGTQANREAFLLFLFVCHNFPMM